MTYSGSIFSRKIVLLPALLLAALAVVAVSAPASEAKKPKRVIALTPFAANTLAQLGSLPKAVGELPAANMNQYHSKIRKGIRNGKIKTLVLSHGNDGPNKEVVTALKPDLILSERTWRGSTRYFRDVARIKVAEHEPYRVGQMKQKTKAIARMVGKKKKGDKLVKKIGKQIKNATKKIKKRPQVLVLMGLASGDYLAFLPNSWGGDLVKRSGGKLMTQNLSHDTSSPLMVSGGFARISAEEIVSRNPEVIIAVPHGTADQVNQIKESFESDPVLANTSAVQSGRLYISIDNRLLQAGTAIKSTIRMVRKYLRS